MDDSLPEHLAERFRWVVSPNQTTHAGEFILYWMHNAMRAQENPALDVAICLARQNGLPLLVYHGLSEDYPYSSDRYHAFILQGDRDVQRQLADRGIASAFHLQHNGNRGPHLRELTRRAAVLVTEEMPVQPLAGWIQRLVMKTKTPIALVNASCIVPTSLVESTISCVNNYSEQTSDLYKLRVENGYVDQVADCQMFRQSLPFQPLDLQDVCLSTLIAQCKVDHTIAPVADTPGGSRAGYRRWEAFKANDLSDYEQQSEDASIHRGVSRMSAYLHFGMVSPFRIAREAQAVGATRYLHSLLMWREVAFHFCCQNIDLIDSIEALPDWANETLQKHAPDQREANYSWEKLARARSGQALWDACQRSLLRHGECHKEARKTWGKTLLSWTRSPQSAVQMTMDLNHRYSLDGRDPSSYGGVLWCYGLFDRPVESEVPIHGTVPTRPIEQHQSSLDFQQYCKTVDRPIAGRLPRVAVIGAGIGGLMASRTLADHGIDVKVFDKSRGVGGRAATRRTEETTFDHGAQYFTARDTRFTRYVQSWIQDGIVAPWMGRIVELETGGKVIDEKTGTPRYVAAPGMNALGKHLAADLDVSLDCRINGLERQGEKWKVITEHDIDERFDFVITNCPPKQSHEIIAEHTSIASQVAQARMRPCWAVMLCADGLSDLDFSAAFINTGPLSWIANNSSKPGRHHPAKGESWTLHASPDWSEANLERTPSEALDVLLPAFESATGTTLHVHHAVAHRWRYAIPANPLETECLWDAEAGIGACGDWCGGPRVEGAFLSGTAMAGTVLRHITIDRPAYSTIAS